MVYTLKGKFIVYLKLLRPHQWVKNLFLFVPLFFAGDFFNYDKLVELLIGFLLFSAISSAVYILNDYKDRNNDKIHPVKKNRPLASGAAKPGFAIVLLVILALGSITTSWFINYQFAMILIVYFVLNILYSLGLKQVSIVDVLIVAIGFVLRTISGGIIADVPISHWLVIMIFLLALFLVVAKRREDLLEYISSGKVLRRSIAKYNIEFINLVLTMLSGVIIVSYIMYSVSPDVNEKMGTNNLYFTSVFVIVGLLRYLQITLVENNSGSPVKILYSDKFTIINLLVWLASFFIIIYFK